MASKPTSRQEALDYHSQGRPGKIEVVSTKPTNNQYDLSLAYSPGVAEPCREIAEDVSKVYDYTARGNLVAVISDGSAVLGLGNIGPEASKPVMEGKGVLFKRFADIDVFDIELATQDVDEIVAAVKAIAPTVSGINLEDISAPRCFEIERRLQAELDIPVFHDDQHGTALISGAALLNACEIAGKKLDEIKLVINGAGASAMACARFAIGLGVQPRNLLMCDSTGVIYAGRTDRMSSYKEDFAVETEARTLAEALVGADAFYGLSVGNVMSPEMLLSMAENPIVFAMANPDPEIPFELAKSTREDVIIGTGRSDHPNQVNNVLGFPFVFRGALDVRASHITNEMLYAAAHALADLAKEPVPTQIAQAYGLDSLEFGRDYIIPKPIDHRVIRRVAPAVAQAAMDSGVARKEVDLAAYTRQLGEGLGLHRNLMNEIVAKARQAAKQIVFPEGEADRIVISAGALVQERIAHPILLGRRAVIEAKAKLHGIDLGHSEIIDPAQFDKLEEYAQDHVKLRAHRGVDLDKARERMHDPLWLGPTMVRHGDADGMVCGVTRAARKTIAAMLRVIPLAGGVRRASALSLVFSKTHGVLGFADTAINIEPTEEELAEIAILAAEEYAALGLEPRVAMLSFSSYGGTPHPASDMVRRAVDIARIEAPGLLIDGEMRVDCALDPLVQERYGACQLGGQPANVLVFPTLQAANIGFNLVRSMAEVTTVGPIYLGLSKPVHVLQPHSSGVQDVVRLTAIAAMQAARNEAQLTVGAAS
ncbi:MAG: NADP-dependent malic enzyme [Planctomycetes bacterium]|nr:NADP-dependent malic enzyme [Planctomycetota bacterium]